MKTIFFISLSFLFFNDLHAVNFLLKYPLEDHRNLTSACKTALNAFITAFKLGQENRPPQVYEKQEHGHAYFTTGILLSLETKDIEYPFKTLLEPYKNHTLTQNKAKRHVDLKEIGIDGSLLFAKYNVTLKTNMRGIAERKRDNSKIWVFSFYNVNKHVYSCMWCETGWDNLKLKVNDAFYFAQESILAPSIPTNQVTINYYGPIYLVMDQGQLYRNVISTLTLEEMHLEVYENYLSRQIQPLTAADLMDLGIPVVSFEQFDEEIELEHIAQLAKSFK